MRQVRGPTNEILGAKIGMFDGVSIFADQGTTGGSTFFTTRVPLSADDMASDVADNLAFFMNREYFPNGTATAAFDTVTLNNIVVLKLTRRSLRRRVVRAVWLPESPSSTLMYAVDDEGGLYSVQDPIV